MTISRPSKLSHGQTILYEIDMFRFAARMLLSKQERSREERWVYLEDFLIHYRNLIDFFGHPNPKRNDLHISRPQLLGEGVRCDSAEISRLRAAGSALRRHREHGADIISKYLHHCTTRRVEDKTWPVVTMIKEIDPLLKTLTNMLSHLPRNWDAQPEFQLSPSAPESFSSGIASTATLVIGSPASLISDDDPAGGSPTEPPNPAASPHPRGPSTGRN